MAERVAGMDIPQAVVDRMSGTPKAAQSVEGIEICVEIVEQVCLIEGVADGCESLDARRLGRRLDRLLKRARCEVMPGEKVP